MKNTPRLIAAVALLFLAAQSLIASGTIRGRVFDRDTKEGLPGANVTIRGTSVGTATDLNGEFVIPNAPAGEQTIAVSYIGYRSTNATVTVPEGGLLKQDFGMVAVALQGQEVIVMGQAQGQIQAINQQLSSNKIANIVSEARIQELPDFNAAAAISRLSGVSTLSSSGEANKVVIRGLAPKYNQITIGGVSLASTGSTQIGVSSQGGTAGSISNDRSVDLSMMSPYMIKSISVYKSLTPDMNANSIGGTVNMELREAPSEFHSDLLFQSGYTQKSNQYGNYRAVGSVSTRFFDNKFGIYALGNIEQYDRDADNMSAGYEITADKPIETGYLPVRVTNVQLNRHFETRKRFGGNLVLDYQMPAGSLKMVNMFSRLNSNYQDFRTIYNFTSLSQDLTFRYQEGENNVDVALNSLTFTHDFGFMTVDLRASNSYSMNSLPNAPQSDFNQTKGVGTPPQETTPENLTYLITYGGTDAAYLNTLTLFSSAYKENGQTYKADVKIPFSVGTALSGNFRIGGEFNQTLHQNSQRTPYATIGGTTPIQQSITAGMRARYPSLTFNTGLNLFPSTGFTSNDPDIYKSFLGDRFGKMLWGNDPGMLTDIIYYISSVPDYSSINATAFQPGGWFDGYFQTLPNTYKYKENYTAGFAMTEMTYGDLFFVGGVRYEKQTGIYDAYVLMDGRDVKSQKYFDVAARPNNEFWLPMVQAKYNVAEWLDVRASYAQSVARPDYHQFSPAYSISYGQGTVRSGNPNLRTAHAYNHDIILTLHSNELGLFSIAGFYKEIKDFTYSTSYSLYTTAPPGIATVNDFNIGGTAPVRGATLFTYINTPYIAFVRGIEVDFQTRFWYLMAPFNGVVFGVNYTKISSNATYPWRNARTTIIGPRQTVTEVFDSTRAGRLINQPNDIVNTYIGYDYKDFSARLSFVFQGNSVSGIGAFSEQDGFTRDYYRFDASVRQILPWFGIELFLDASNLNNRNNASAQKTIGGFTNEQNYGLTANIGLRYRL